MRGVINNVLFRFVGEYGFFFFFFTKLEETEIVKVLSCRFVSMVERCSKFEGFVHTDFNDS